ncbi:MAG: hypothetical protein Q8L14_10240 [Myxococcales bacterium]|nr:hypothetical protein [Myxococcales bacterium]
MLAELGWIEKDVEGWIATDLGKKQGALEKHHAQSGVPYVVWPETIVSNEFFAQVVAEFATGPEATAILQTLKATGATVVPPTLVAPPVPSLPTAAPLGHVDSESMASIAAREKFRAEYRAADGHFVRSRAELAIDNWLYMNMVIHAFERRVPIGEDILSDFYLPEGKVYIEYWGMESDPAYAARKEQKLKLYRSEGIPLIELTDEHLRNLDDHLPRLLLKHKISVKMR